MPRTPHAEMEEAAYARSFVLQAEVEVGEK
jgi:hypothetical protein